MSYARAPSSDFWIIGYGNPQRRDDGIGPYIVNRLQPLFKHRKDVHLLALHPPAFISGLLQCLYHRHPKTWMVSVEGADFGFGTGLSSVAQKRATQVISEIAEFVLTEVLEKDRITGINLKSEARNGKYETISKS